MDGAGNPDRGEVGVLFVVVGEFCEPGLFEAEEGGVGEELFVELDDAGGRGVDVFEALGEGEAIFFGHTDIKFEAV